MGNIVLKLDVVMADRHMSLNELADRIGISQSYISRLEKKIIRKLRVVLEGIV